MSFNSLYYFTNVVNFVQQDRIYATATFMYSLLYFPIWQYQILALSLPLPFHIFLYAFFLPDGILIFNFLLVPLMACLPTFVKTLVLGYFDFLVHYSVLTYFGKLNNLFWVYCTLASASTGQNVHFAQYLPIYSMLSCIIQ